MGQVLGPFTLDQAYTCDQNDDLFSAAINAATATVDFSSYTRVMVVFPVTATGCYYAGLAEVGCVAADSLIAHPHSPVWIPVFPSYATGTDLVGILSHELGHNLGLNHSNSLDFGSIPLGPFDFAFTNGGIIGDTSGGSSSGAALNEATSTARDLEYGDPYSVMGQTGNEGQYNAFHKAEILGWLGSSDFQEVTSSGTFTLAPFEQSSGLRALRILRNPLTSSWLWVEYRQPSGVYDGDFLPLLSGTNVYQGALVHYEDQYSADGHSYLLDFNPVAIPNYFPSSDMTSGETWSDPYSPLTLTVNNLTSSGLNFTANYDQTCATLTSSANVFPSTASSGTITVTAPASCSWQASTAASWITFTGATSGQGNGVVNFSISANPNPAQLNSYITIQRQSVPIAQQGTGIFVGAMTPSLGSGSSGDFTLTFNDPNGASDAGEAFFYLQGAENCWVSIVNATSNLYTGFNLYLNSDEPGSSLPGLTVGVPGTASNSVCSLYGIGSSFNYSGNQWQVTLRISFTQAFTGSHRMWASVQSYIGGSTNWIPVGTWTVTTNPSIVDVTPSFAPPGAAMPITISGNLTHFASNSTVTFSGTGISAADVVPTSNTQLNATLTVAANAPVGTQTLTVTTGARRPRQPSR